MTAVTLANNGLKAGFLPGENGWADAMNLNMRLIDALMQGRALDKDLNAPPSTPATGDVYLVGPAPTGAWAGQSEKIAIWQEGDDLTTDTWYFVVPKKGNRMFVVDESVPYEYDGADWKNSASNFASYSQNFGDGAAASYTITHGLNSRNVHVSVFRVASPFDEVIVDVARTTVDTITISGFGVPPALNSLTIYVSK